MAETLAALHLIAVLAVALWTRSRFLTWVGALAVGAFGVGVGGSPYDILDVIATLVGLVVGLAFIRRKATPQKPSASVPGTSPTAVPNPVRRVSAPDPHSEMMGPAKMFELHSHPERGNWWWVGLFVALLIAGGLFYG